MASLFLTIYCLYMAVILVIAYNLDGQEATFMASIFRAFAYFVVHAGFLYAMGFWEQGGLWVTITMLIYLIFKILETSIGYGTVKIKKMSFWEHFSESAFKLILLRLATLI